MATRYQVSLAHQGCTHTGSVVWEERRKSDPSGSLCPVAINLPRGFVSVTTDDGSIEILCSGCAQVVASATSCVVPATGQENPADATAQEDQSQVPVIEPASIAPATASNLEMLFAEHPDVPPIRGDAIPHHLVGRLRHLAGRLRGETS